MQSDGPGQDTLSRLPPAGVIPGGLGTGVMSQPFPFQCSATSACRGELSMPVPPTAMQLDGLVQETPIKPLGSAPGRLGVFWIFQVWPFQDSARLTGVLKPFAAGPAAMQNEDRGQETAKNPLAEARGRFGVAWMDHVVPFHRSASVTLMPELLTLRPTASQADELVQDTPLRNPNCDPDGLGVGWIAQLVPFHRSARLTPVPELLISNPTVSQAEGEAQSTPNRTLACAPAGLGVGCVIHLDPVHRSARVPELDPPIDTQTEDEGQATPKRTPPPDGGLGVG
jgi:hypothetical protein